MAGIKGPQLPPHQPPTAPASAKAPAPAARGPKQVSGPKKRSQVDADVHEEEHSYTDRHDPDEAPKGRHGGGQPHGQSAEFRLAGAFTSPQGAGGLNMRSAPRQLARHEGRASGVEGSGHTAEPSSGPRALADRAIRAFMSAPPERQATARAALSGPWVG